MITQGRGFKEILISILISILFLSIPTIIGRGNGSEKQSPLTIFAAAIFEVPFEDLAETYKKETEKELFLNFGGSGQLISQLKLSGKGDIYIAASNEFMDKAIKEGVVDPKTVKTLAYALLTMNVRKGNPKSIKGLSDLKRKDIRIALGNPDSVAVGQYAIEFLKKQGLWNKVKERIVTYSPNYSHLLSLLILNKVDLVFGWSTAQFLKPSEIENIYVLENFKPAYVSAAVTNFSKNLEGSSRFLNFLLSPSARAIYSKWGLLVPKQEYIKNKDNR